MGQIRIITFTEAWSTNTVILQSIKIASIRITVLSQSRGGKCKNTAAKLIRGERMESGGKRTRRTGERQMEREGGGAGNKFGRHFG